MRKPKTRLATLFAAALTVSALLMGGATPAEAAPAVASATIPTNFPLPPVPACEGGVLGIGKDCSKHDLYGYMLRIMNEGERSGNRNGAVRLMLTTLLGDKIVGFDSGKVAKTKDKALIYLFTETLRTLNVSGREGLRCYATTLMKAALAKQQVYATIDLFNAIVEKADQAHNLRSVVKASGSDKAAAKYLAKKGFSEATGIPTSMLGLYIAMAKDAGRYMGIKAFSTTLYGPLEDLLSKCTSVSEFPKVTSKPKPTMPAPPKPTGKPVVLGSISKAPAGWKTYTTTVSAKQLLAGASKKTHFVDGGGCKIVSNHLYCYAKTSGVRGSLVIHPNLTYPQKVLSEGMPGDLSTSNYLTMQVTSNFTLKGHGVNWSYDGRTRDTHGTATKSAIQTLKAVPVSGMSRPSMSFSFGAGDKVVFNYVKITYAYKPKPAAPTSEYVKKAAVQTFNGADLTSDSGDLIGGVNAYDTQHSGYCNPVGTAITCKAYDSANSIHGEDTGLRLNSYWDMPDDIKNAVPGSLVTMQITTSFGGIQGGGDWEYGSYANDPKASGANFSPAPSSQTLQVAEFNGRTLPNLDYWLHVNSTMTIQKVTVNYTYTVKQ